MTSFINCLQTEPIVYLSAIEVIELHRSCIEQYGGANGIRDMGLLESAVERPKSGYYPTITVQAAALLESLLVNHPFVDGNKRASFAAADIFLRMNGLILYIPPRIAETFLCNYSHKNFSKLVSCIESNVDLAF